MLPDYLKKNYVWIACLLVILIAAFSLFGINGIVVILGMLIFLFLPAYLIIRNFGLEQDEKIIFSFFSGFGLFPVVVYLIYYIVKSLKVSIAVSFVLLVLIGIGLHYYRKKKSMSI